MVEVNPEQATDSSHEPEEATVTLNFEITNPLREQDLTSGMNLDQGAGTEGGPELLLSPPPTVQDSAVLKLLLWLINLLLDKGKGEIRGREV
ncbi:hypothetical protein F2P79_008463 [Pimephales promelas]|nr:hypothetical protein F2P79_008463 [Pimephales promelas]